MKAEESQEINYRSVGKTSIHYRPRNKVQAKTTSKLSKSTTPSVPSKWEPVELTHSLSQEGFGSKSGRFAPANPLLEELPGPAMYKNTNDFIIRSPSVSKKGYGSAFTSTAPKLDRSAALGPGGVAVVISRALSPGPGDYDPPSSPIKKASTNIKGSPTFIPSKEDRKPYIDPLHSGLGPGAYNLRKFSSSRGKERKSATYKSVMPRGAFLINNSGVPPVGSYESSDMLPRVEQEIQWAARREGEREGKRTCMFDCDESIPGPGRYFQDEEKETKNTLRSVGSFSGSLRPQPSFTSSARPKTMDDSRFKNSYLGRLDLSASLPGPGWYDPLQYEHDEQNGEKHPTSVFKSTSPSRHSLLKPLSQRTPGPAYYTPHSPSSRKFSVNVDRRWE
eukprot:CAMPEP_0182417048 /NCGR_PEP_ID=MMETSP1167-20130531/1460_1 /TAXON_ID=2988 /ORGANISM="Mallomonas Sp, Strain CCMP3275" /LENGTH=390 /DNA_ID=CAMNT_0024590329 /DNA_START=209 /DNA_END=1381 /DNA_ORIENTATION=-